MTKSGAVITLAAVIFTVSLFTSGSVVDPGVAYADFQIDASPKGVYANLAALIAADPDHSRIYLTTDNGHWNYWDGASWISGGTYQSSGLPDEVKAQMPQLTDLASGAAHNTGDIGTSMRDIVTPYMRSVYPGNRIILRDPTGTIRLLVINYDEYGNFLNWEDLPTNGIKTFHKPGMFRVQARKKDGTNHDPAFIALVNTPGTIVFEFFRISEPKNYPLYVALGGSDENDGLSLDKPLETLQEAIDRGANKIYITRHVFPRMSAVCNDPERELSIIATGDYEVTPERPDRPLARLYSGKNVPVSSMTSHGSGIYSIADTDVPSGWEQVFITHSLPPETTGSRPSYNASLWQLHTDEANDALLKPVLSLAECQSTPDSFFWDGTTWTVNLAQTSGTMYLVVAGYAYKVLDITGCKKVTLVDIECRYGATSNFDLRSIEELQVINCHSRYTTTGNGFVANDTNGRFDGCLSSHARNDGYNMHGFGRIDLYDCKGIHNRDDGVSHHDGLTGVIVGGEWAYNGKAGIASPTSGAQVDIHNAITHHNTYGIYAVGTQDMPVRSIRMTANASYENSAAGLLCVRMNITGYQNHFSNNTTAIEYGTDGVYVDLDSLP